MSGLPRLPLVRTSDYASLGILLHVSTGLGLFGVVEAARAAMNAKGAERATTRLLAELRILGEADKRRLELAFMHEHGRRTFQGTEA
jgi:hypothetical protein